MRGRRKYKDVVGEDLWNGTSSKKLVLQQRADVSAKMSCLRRKVYALAHAMMESECVVSLLVE